MRKAKTEIAGNENLLDVISELYLEDMQGNINPTKLDQLLGKNSNRVIGRYQLKPAKADGRPGWSVERLRAPPSPDFIVKNLMKSANMELCRGLLKLDFEEYFYPE